jgi:A/G-specific adenine glycosylase
MKEFSETLISWYQISKRDLPWRNTNNPYFIWLSEIILQQTRVEQGMPYYLKFTEAFPTIYHLAQASQDEVLRLWQGLGYYSRGRNLHFTANQVIKEFNGNFPTNYEELLKLKGIGNYTAAAISSFCANQANAVVDGNVYRLLARYFGVELDISLGASQKEFQRLANELLNEKQPGMHNQAIMEFGALQCVPKNPNCTICPLQDSCFAYAQKKVELLPIKGKKVKNRTRYFYYLVLKKANSTLIKRRKEGDIWEGLYEFPLIEFNSELDEQSVLNSAALAKILNETDFDVLSISRQFKHQLTHQTIFCKFFILNVKSFSNINGFENVVWTKLDNYPKPILIQRFIVNLNELIII